MPYFEMKKSVFLAEIPESSWVSEPFSEQSVGKNVPGSCLGEENE
jgi:hypothetical protein